MNDNWEELREAIQLTRDQYAIAAAGGFLARDDQIRAEASMSICDRILAAMDRYDNNEEGALK